MGVAGMWVLIGGAVVAGAAIMGLFIMLGRLSENTAAMGQATRELLNRFQSVEVRLDQSEKILNDGLRTLRDEIRDSSREGREESARSVNRFGEGIISQHQLLVDQLGQLMRLNDGRMVSIQQTVEDRLRDLQTGNEERLEKMRALVDEKLHATLEKRLGEAFASVSERLEKVHQGLGEMKALTADMGDLKKVLTNVKARGTWGEIQLGALLDQILTPEQYGKNVATRPGKSERVEFAIRLPGVQEGTPVWMPIDSKFPQEDYLRIIAASEAADAEALAESTKALERRVVAEAKSIHEKYIEPPHTTDFAILYLPVEGLYAEVLRMNGLCERLTREYRVVIAGPTTIAALLNSLQMGFRTLAIEKRSSEVWVLLGQVKTEFGKFGDVLEKARIKIEQVGKELGNAQVRTRSIERRLRQVQELPGGMEEDALGEVNVLDTAEDVPQV
ncbi:MAG: DNA recombination protein RmuC [Synergistaceae bacterium]|nr:DNA recombination protein RmuC [Synergistaceae bacterium]